MDNIKRKYGYSYDHQHRLTAAYYQLPGTVIPRSDSYSTSYSYDENGNILSLKRNGKEDDPNLLMEIDDLDYTYDQGNRLLKVKDATNNPSGFNMNGAGINAQYAYDDFGNLKTDPYKKISHISYNHLNLPVKITFTGGETIEYTYLADGTKLKKTAKDAESNTTTTEYREGFQYIDDVLEFFPTTEGYVKYNSNNLIDIYSYVFTYTDHLGNIRLKYTENPQTGELTILEEDHYYPYGLTHEGYNGNHKMFVLDPTASITLIDVTPDLSDPHQYKFNGMEWQDEFDVNVYDFGARNYDPALGRWMNIDPLAEMMRRHSPYNYAFNNPVYFIDPDGMFSMPWGMFMENASVDSPVNKSNDLQEDASGLDSQTSTTNNAEAYSDYFGNVADNATNADVSLGGGCPDGDCGDLYKNYRNEFENNLQHKFRNDFTFNDAIWHYRLGKGMPVNVAASSLNFSSISVEDFKNSDYTYQGHSLIYARLSDIMGMINNTNQALIYGTVGVVHLGEGTIMVLPDIYDFDIKFDPSLRGISRDLATILGQWFNGAGTSYYIQFEGTAKINNK